jgi:hypothetical protein
MRKDNMDRSYLRRILVEGEGDLEGSGKGRDEAL